MDYIISESNILLVSVFKPIPVDGGFMISEDEYLYKVVFVDHVFLSFENGEELIQPKWDKNGDLLSEIYENTTYILETYKCDDVTENDIEYANMLYQNYLEKKELIKSKKILKFPQNRLY